MTSNNKAVSTRGWRGDRAFLAGLCLARLIFTVWALSLVPPVRAHAGSTFGKVSKLSGSAKVQRGAIGPWLGLSTSAPIYTGDRAVTGDNCRIEVTLAIGGILRIDENSQVDFEEKSGGVTGVRVWLGRVWSTITKALTPASKFEVATPTAVAAVRGTEFFVDVDGDEAGSEADNSDGTEVGVIEGEVEVTDLAEEMSVMEQHGGKLEGATTPYALRLLPNESLRIGSNRMMQRQINKPVESVAILPFKVRTQKEGKPVADSGIGMSIATHFAEGFARAARGRFQVIPPTDAVKKLASLNPPSVDFFHANAFSTLARQAGWDAIVVAVIFDGTTSGGAGVANNPQQSSRPPKGRGEPDHRDQRNQPPVGRKSETPQKDKPMMRKVLVLRLILASTGAEIVSRKLPLTAYGQKDASLMKGEVMRLANTITGAMPDVAPVVKVDGNQVTLRGGTHGAIKVGSKAVVLKRDAEWRDPRTGMRLGSKMAAIIEVTEVQPHAVIARVIRAIPNMEIQTGDIAVSKLPGEDQASLKPSKLDMQAMTKNAWYQWNMEQQRQ